MNSRTYMPQHLSLTVAPLLSRVSVAGRKSLESSPSLDSRPSSLVSSQRHIPPIPPSQLADSLSVSFDQAKADQLIELLQQGHTIESKYLHIPITSLCASEAKPLRQKFGYRILAAYLSTNSDIHVLEKGIFWKALCAAGPEWVAISSASRSDALHHLVGDGSDLSGLDNFLESVKDWASSAASRIVTSPRDEAEQREQFVAGITRVITKVTKNSPTLLSDQHVSGLIEMYGGWAESEELPWTNQVASVTPTAHAPWPFHHRHKSSIGKIVTPPEPDISTCNSMGATMFTKLIQSYLDADILLPIYILPRVTTILCTSLGQTMPPLVNDQPPFLGSNSQGSDLVAKLLLDLVNDRWYSATTLKALEDQITRPTGTARELRTAAGAMRTLRLIIYRSYLSENPPATAQPPPVSPHTDHSLPVTPGSPTVYEQGSNLLAIPWSEGTHRALQFERSTSRLGSFVDIWLDRDGGDDVLLELAGIVHDLLGPWDSSTHHDVSRLSGEVIVKLSTLVEAYRHSDGSVYKLRLPERNSGPTSLLRSVGDLLRRPLETTTTHPPLASILLGLESHLVDGDVVNVITYLQETRQLAPSCPDWLNNVRKLINCFYRPLFPRCRKAIAAAIAELYRDISDLEVFRLEIVEDVVSMWERTLPDEQNEDTIKHAWDVMSRELVLSTAAQENDEESHIAQRIRNTWVAVARNSPSYYDSIYGPSIPSLTNATPVTTPNVHLRRDYPLTPPPMGSEPATPATERINPLVTIQPRKAILAVTLLINAFNTLAFSSPQSLTILLDNADRPQSVSSALTALELFKSLVNLLSPATPPEGRVHCPKARLVILSWLLRLRADREHRIFAKLDLCDETLTLARLIRRADRPKVQTPPLADVQGPLAERRRNRAQTRGNVDLANAAASRDAREGGRKESRGRTEHLVNSISRSRSRPPITLPRTPPVGTTPPTRPAEMLWALPEKLYFELGSEALRPSPAMTTYESVMGGTGTYWLPVSLYVAALCEILVNDKDWEIVSYVLVHLPLQLSNKHFFCGPKVKEQMRKLIRIVSTAINEDRLAHNMDMLLPVGTVTVVDVQGLLYHTLMVCISYHKIFDTSAPTEGMKSPGYGISDLKSDILEVIVTGLARDEVTNIPCLEALSLAVYELPGQLAKFTSTIVEKLSQIMSNPNMAVHILEVLVVIGYSPKLWSNSFRQEDYRRVFGVALKYIEHHNRPDAPTLRTSDGRDSFSLAQHVLNTAYTVMYQWFSSIRISDRPVHVPFITEQLLLANRHRDRLDAAAEVCFDWLARYTYGNADPKPAFSFLYRSIVAPSAGEFTADRSWVQQTRDEMENTMILKAWKLGNAIITISTMKKPKGWIRMQARRPSGITELVCRVENWPHVTLGDVEPDFLSLPATLLSERSVDGIDGLSAEDQVDLNGLVPESELQERVHHIFEQPDVIKDVDQPDPISGYVWSGIAPSQRRKEVSIDPSYVALMLSSYPTHIGDQRRQFQDLEKLKGLLASIDTTPVIDTHKVGVVYVAPGQKTEQEILANSHGSPAYSRFLADLGRVIKPSNRLEVYTGGLSPDRHGEYAYAWWDDISQVIYHVATIMPNRDNGFWKKQEIGNDGVKIIWNDGGTPFALNTINSQFSLINIVVEPHSIGSRSAYSDNQHENEFFKITLQKSARLPQVTPIGEFKIVSAESLSLVLRHFSLLASLFANAWERTGRDSEDPTERIPFLTNWQQRLRFITNSERLLSPQLPPKPHPPGVPLMEREAGRDFTLSF